MTPDPTTPLLSVDDLVVQYHRPGAPPPAPSPGSASRCGRAKSWAW